ncbi:MAG: CpsD/CapB family tyrosine-protein kinase [Pseudomonadota bacterium]
MERIKQALERAKREREGSAPSNRATVREIVTPHATGRTEDIVYTETRVFKPDPAVLESNRVIGSAAASAVADAYRMLRTRTLQRMKENQWTSLMVTSPGMEEGKSLTAVNLAISMAREVSHTVLLVDLDLRRPGIHEFFGYEPEAGLVDVLESKANMSDALFNPSVERLVVLPSKRRVDNSSEILSSPEMLSVIAEIKARYPERIVIFDMPPVLSTDDALAFSPNVDAVMLVVAEGETGKGELAQVHEVLSESNIIGTVLNKAANFNTAYY